MMSVGFDRFGSVRTLAAGIPGIDLERIPVPARAEARHRRAVEAFSWEEVPEVGPADFPHPRTANAFHRGYEFVNWMVHEPWVREGRTTPGKGSGYFFSDTYLVFRYVILRIRDRASGKPKGFIVLSLSRPSAETQTWLKVLDHRFRNPPDRACVLPIAWEYAHAHGATQVRFSGALSRYLPESRLANAPVLESRRPFFCCPRNARGKLSPDPSTMRLEYTDGDTAFT